MDANDYEALMNLGRRRGADEEGRTRNCCLGLWPFIYQEEDKAMKEGEKEGNGTHAACPTSFTQPYSRVTGKHNSMVQSRDSDISVWRACTHTQTLAWPWVDRTSEKPWPRSLIKPRRATITHMRSLWSWITKGKRRLSHGNTSPFHFSPPVGTKMLHWKRQARKRIPQPIVGDHQGDDCRFALCAVPPPLPGMPS